MDRQQFADYVDCFNRKDFEGFTSYYTDDVVFELGDRRAFQGLDAIVAFYKEASQRVKETGTVQQVVIDDGGVAAELESEFVALQDWPDFPSGPMKKGDIYRRRGLIMYTLRDGKFSYIRSGRIKVLAGPWTEGD